MMAFAPPFRRPALPPGVPGELYLSAMPGRYGSWPEFLADARKARLALVVCLTPLEEVAERSRDYHVAIAEGTLPFRWMHLPMQNFGLPGALQEFRAGIDHTANALRGGDAVLMHCAAGIGRTGTAAACVLKRLGLGTAQTLQHIRQAGSNPESALQSGLVDSF
jgi:protein-tyrosine phosphatase